MSRYYRTLIALAILLSGLAVLPQVGLIAEVVGWQRFAGGYEDIVTVTRARYRDGQLEVRATSTGGGAVTLHVYQTTGDHLIGTLAYVGGSEHAGEFAWPTNPQVITVRSTGGGESTVLVSGDSDVPVTVTPSATPPGPTVTPTTNPGTPPPRLFLPLAAR